ncbi:MAG TPA: efflux RND transporter periplasmic adaptor subunit [Steroidobacteraceae bacterium]|nr:efflux RND transporter periplasmic adaptor subunit [Steroidobacteraceae bacterium]
MPHRPSRPLVRPALLLLFSSLVGGCGQPQGGPPGGEMPAPEVGVETATVGRVPTLLEYTGRAAGSREVEVRARVGGILLERRYEEGQSVRQGDVLFVIDPEPYRAAAAQARAELGVARARLEEARRQRDRIVPLFEKNATSQRQRDEAVSQFEVAQATVAAAQARLRTAELDLGYTEVRAPISGSTSREARSEGSLVETGGDSSLLTRIVQTHPVYVEFSVPETEAARMRGAVGTSGAALVVKVLLDGGTADAVAGRLSFIDTSVEPGSGTVRARATFDNADGRIVPGQFVRVRVDGVAEPDAVSVSRRAVMSSAQGNFVWVVDKDDVVELRPVKLAGDASDRALIASGLTGGERVVVDGVLKVRPGSKVKVAAPAAAAGPPAAPPAGGAAEPAGAAQ